MTRVAENVRSRFCSWRLVVAMSGFVLALVHAPVPLRAQEAQWIWSPEQAKDAVPAGATVWFRRGMTLKAPVAISISVAADDECEVFFNGRKLGASSAANTFEEYDATSFAVPGVNLLAIKATNRDGATAALAARVLVKETDGPWVSYSTNEHWKTSRNVSPLWNTVVYNETGWKPAQLFGKLGVTEPWDRSRAQTAPVVKPAPAVASKPTQEDEQDNAAAKSEPESKPAAESKPAGAPESTAGRSFTNERFSIDAEFQLERLLEDEETGSLLAIGFTELGRLIASQEGGPLLAFDDSDDDGLVDQVEIVCEEVENCQGIAAVNGELFVTADGPDGAALYRLTDADRDGVYEQVRSILPFGQQMSEHGPHAVTLGPDGFLYVMVGNETQLPKFDASSPYRNPYEGDLVGPRYEDPGGHAVGVKAPGGCVIRTDVDGSSVQLVAGGLRNAYDMAFNRAGELFTADSDMEADEGTLWHRTTRVELIVPGGEYGWRSGWANWPEYWSDMLPAVASLGRGSPTGMVVYDHIMFPQRFHGSLFIADWAQGKIYTLKPRDRGAGYVADPRPFLEGNPLNVTDVDVGPDGALYFCTGGRGTSGALYRVTWRGEVPEKVKAIGPGLPTVARQPQPQSAYARQKIAVARRELAEDWEDSLVGMAAAAKNPTDYRARALDVMRLYGPDPSEELLLKLASDADERVRIAAMQPLSASQSTEARAKLIACLGDDEPRVQRMAAQALAQGNHLVPYQAIRGLLASDDRLVAFSGRRLLERQPIDGWFDGAMAETNPRVLAQSAMAAVIAKPDRDVSLRTLQALSDALDRFATDRDFIQILRAMQVAIQRGGLTPDATPGLKVKLAEEFPAGDPLLNRELVRLLVYLQEGSILDRYLEYIAGDAPAADRLHVAMHLRFLESGWSPEQRMKLLEFFESAQNRKAGTAVTRYIINATRDFAMKLTAEEGRAVLLEGSRWPNAALGALFKLPKELDDETFAVLADLDKKLDPRDDAQQRLQIGIVAVMARCGDERCFAHLRKTWERDPERRQAVAMGLALSPGGDNWPYIVRTLGALEPAAAPGVLKRLAMVDERPAEAEPYRSTIVLGLRLAEKGPDKGASEAIALLEHWMGEPLGEDADDLETKLGFWQEWYAEEFPEDPPAELPVSQTTQSWTWEQLYEFLIKAPERKGDLAKGAKVFVKAQCAKCHKAGPIGESIGPDLTAVSKRFMKKEILEATYYPSHVVSDQYAAKIVALKNGKQLVGIVAATGGGEYTITTATGERTTVRKSEVDEIETSRLSIMPEGLFNDLEKTEIEDLFAFLGEPTRVRRKSDVDRVAREKKTKSKSKSR